MKKLTICDGVKEIGNGAFRGAPLKSVTIPKSVEVLGTNAFDESTKILLAYWEDLPHSKRFEFLMKLAELKER